MMENVLVFWIIFCVGWIVGAVCTVCAILFIDYYQRRELEQEDDIIAMLDKNDLYEVK